MTYLMKEKNYPLLSDSNKNYIRIYLLLYLNSSIKMLSDYCTSEFSKIPYMLIKELFSEWENV